MARGMELPEAIANAPQLWEGLEWYYAAFWELGSCRPLGFGALGPIPWTAVSEYGRRHDVAGDQFDYLVHHLRHMDEVWLKWVRENKPSGNPGEPVRDDAEAEPPGDGGG